MTAYRTMPLAKAPPPPRKWPARATVAAAAFTAGSSAFLLFVDVAAHFDGPGYGYFGHSGFALFGLTSLVAAITTIACMGRWPWARWEGLVAGVVGIVAFVALGIPIRLLHASWTLGCTLHGSRACWVASTMYEHDDPKRVALERRGCADRDLISCTSLIDREKERAATCADLQRSCSANVCRDLLAHCASVER